MQPVALPDGCLYLIQCDNDELLKKRKEMSNSKSQKIYSTGWCNLEGNKVGAPRHYIVMQTQPVAYSFYCQSVIESDITLEHQAEYSYE